MLNMPVVIGYVDCLSCDRNLRIILEGETTEFATGDKCPRCHENAIRVS